MGANPEPPLFIEGEIVRKEPAQRDGVHILDRAAGATPIIDHHTPAQKFRDIEPPPVAGKRHAIRKPQAFRHNSRLTIIIEGDRSNGAFEHHFQKLAHPPSPPGEIVRDVKRP